jgi:hypothetical protein
LFIVSWLLAPSVFAADRRDGMEPNSAAARKEGIVVVGFPPAPSCALPSARSSKTNSASPSNFWPRAGRKCHAHHYRIQCRGALLRRSGAGGATPLSMIASRAADDFNSLHDFAGSEGSKELVGRHIWEDNVSTKNMLTLSLLHKRNLVVQQQPGRTQRNSLLRRSVESQVERAHRSARSAKPRFGQNTWSFLWKTKGEEYLTKLAQQDLLIIRTYANWRRLG